VPRSAANMRADHPTLPLEVCPVGSETGGQSILDSSRIK
jgi:hypothetical protein